ncbi:hypothetical protein Pyn_06414 [Prunus yedoensis var. nudiflora]|uniref:Uncharacterized protein n=1 Tax=Prunus yedoensis var. nudiflora TaxID=2094558 RepID=A0A314Z5F2_PRUYE|nr:hypothetical protein Pyn_06414 [Prunus yedoensis var. nudiflora]
MAKVLSSLGWEFGVRWLLGSRKFRGQLGVWCRFQMIGGQGSLDGLGDGLVVGLVGCGSGLR